MGPIDYGMLAKMLMNQSQAMPAAMSNDPRKNKGVNPMNQTEGAYIPSGGGGGYSVSRIGNTEIRHTTRTDAYGKPFVEINGVYTAPSARGQGSARNAMQSFLKDADTKGLRTFLSVDPMEKGVSRTGLERLYSSLGFSRNVGRNKDFSSTAGWLRQPK